MTFTSSRHIGGARRSMARRIDTTTYVGAQSFEIKSLARDSPTLTRRSDYQTRTAKKRKERKRENGNLDRNICAKRHVYKRIRPSVAAGPTGNTNDDDNWRIIHRQLAPAGQKIKADSRRRPIIHHARPEKKK